MNKKKRQSPTIARSIRDWMLICFELFSIILPKVVLKILYGGAWAFALAVLWSVGILMIFNPGNYITVDGTVDPQTIIQTIAFLYLLASAFILAGFYCGYRMLKHFWVSSWFDFSDDGLELNYIAMGASPFLRHMRVEPYYGRNIIYPCTGELSVDFDEVDLEDYSDFAVLEDANSNISSLRLRDQLESSF